MSNSLKDQLLALGLAPKNSKAEPQKPQKPQTPQTPQKPKLPKPKPEQTNQHSKEITLDQAYRIRIREERQQEERAAEHKREQERQRRQVNQQIQTLISEYAIRDPAAENKRNFLYKGRIRSVLATPKQINEINSGALGIVYLSGNYHLLPADKIDAIRQFAPDHIPDLHGAVSAAEDDHPVPDDLIW
jgi:uncharacterized protein YaiL (DUF2058 family)